MEPAGAKIRGGSSALRVVPLLLNSGSGVEGTGDDERPNSSTGDTCPPFGFPKPSFHLDCFLIEAVAGEGAGEGSGGGAEPVKTGNAYMETGSIRGGRRPEGLEVADEAPEAVVLLVEAREAWLISRAKDCKDWEATARVASVSSCDVGSGDIKGKGGAGIAGGVAGLNGVDTAGDAELLPLRAPRFLLLWLEVEREFKPSVSDAILTLAAISPCGLCSSSSSCSSTS